MPLFAMIQEIDGETCVVGPRAQLWTAADAVMAEYKTFLADWCDKMLGKYGVSEEDWLRVSMPRLAKLGSNGPELLFPSMSQEEFVKQVLKANEVTQAAILQSQEAFKRASEEARHYSMLWGDSSSIKVN